MFIFTIFFLSFSIFAEIFENFEYKTRDALFKVWDSKNFMPGKTLDDNPYYYYPAKLSSHKSTVMCVALRTMPIGTKVPKNFTPKTDEDIRSIQIYKVVPEKYRKLSKFENKKLLLSWTWNTIIPPKGADDFTLSDNSFAIYVIFDSGFYSVKYIKYTWSPNSNINYGYVKKISNGTRYVVVRRMAKDPMGVWLQESVDIMKDVKKFFSKNWKALKFVAIAILSDSDDAKKPILACIDDIALDIKD